MSYLIRNKQRTYYLAAGNTVTPSRDCALKFETRELAEQRITETHCEHYEVIAEPVSTDRIVWALRAILGEIGPDMMRHASIQQAYDLMQQIDERGHE